MISFREAQTKIDMHPMTCAWTIVSIEQALGCYIAEKIFAPINLPPFNNSAVDGFAIHTESATATKTMPVLTSLRARAQEEFVLPPLTTAKIMTGAPVPKGANAVVMKEDVVLEHDIAQFSTWVKPYENIRFAGEDLKQGDLVATPGMRVTPQLLAVLLGLGIDRVCVVKPPKVTIIATGDELVDVGRPLHFGQVYALVGPMLKAQCLSLGVANVSITRVSDNEAALDSAIKAALTADLVLISGGMSKGDHDLVRPALKKNGVTEVFYQGAWRPGKPLFFGIRGDCHVFGLPGNPVAAFVCFHVFVRRLIENAFHAPEMATKTAVLRTTYEKKSGFTLFARAHVTPNHELSILPGQGSHQIFSLSRANAICVVNPERAIVKAGEVVQYYPI